MQDLENNMDELLRKAAGKYGLKEGVSNWDAILPQLVSNSIAAATPKKNNLKKYVPLLLLLLLFLVAGGFYMRYLVSKNNLADISSKPSQKNNMVNPDKQADSMNNKVATVYKMQKQKTEPSEKKYSLKQNEEKESIKNKFAVKSNSRSASLNKFHKMTPMDSHKANRMDRNKMVLKEVESSFKMRVEKSATRQFDLTNKLTTFDISNKIIKENMMIVQKKNTADSQSTFVRKGVRQNKHGIYIGVVLGPSLNEVKNQGLKKAGFDVGIIGGYQINSKISIETGLSFAKKYYYSDGKYFNPGKTNTSMPAGMKVLSLEGSSAVIEIPLKVKYNVLHKNKASVFSSAGISSYIVTNEKNTYHAILNSTEQYITSSYKKGTGYFAAAVDLSLGYEKKIGKSTSIRIEPYLQIPLKGIGVGSMPVITTGLHIGITNLLHR